MQVSESACSSLVVEIVLYGCSRQRKETDIENHNDINTTALYKLQTLESQGALVGLRLAERLLYREPSFSGVPSEVVRFIGFNLWKSVFGRRCDSMKQTENLVFSISDRDIAWLRGFPRSKNCEEIKSTALLCSSQRGEIQDGLPFGEAAEYTHQKEMLFYIVGIVKGAVNILCGGCHAAVTGVINNSGEARFTLDFTHSKK